MSRGDDRLALRLKNTWVFWASLFHRMEERTESNRMERQ